MSYFGITYGLFLSIFLSVISYSQDADTTKKENKWKDKIEFGGYIKYMNINQFVNLDTFYTDNLIHNRLNFKFYVNDYWAVSVEARNRVFYGETIKLNPTYASSIGADQGTIDMSWNIVDEGAFLVNSTIDRANFSFNKGKWSIKAGRQRINWGINMVWNPNDLFNAYNFVDFDYQERPGSDALRIQYYNKPMSQIELAYMPGEDLDETILAGLYRFNKKGYDIQFLGGNYRTDIAVGTGWAGAIKTVGFKGEATYFHPKESFADTSGSVTSSISFDYTFDKGIYLNVSGYYNSLGSSSGNFLNALSINNSLTAKNLLPTEFAGFVQLSGQFNPIFGGGISAMYLSDINGVFLIPTLNHSISQNWDLDAVGQVLFGEYPGDFQNISNAVFLRIRWSF